MVTGSVGSEGRARRAVVLLALIVAAALFIVSTPSDAQAAATDLEQCFLDKINAARAANGAGPLTWAPDIEDYTRQHSQTMAGWDDLVHSTGSAISGALPNGWTSWGENIGWQSHPNPPDCTTMHNAFMNSPGHRSNLLNDNFEFAATGTIIAGNGALWTTHVFFSHPTYSPGGEPETWDGTFSDDDGSVFEDDIESIADAGITTGCTETEFCPDAPVSRGQMAAFLARALGLSSSTDAGFSDTGGVFQDDINAIAAAGITQGCAPGKFCPNDSLTRAQMAAFLDRAFDLPGAGSAGFDDTAGHPFEAEIDRLAAAEITLGCGGGDYCPEGVVSRGQMAAFIARALGL